MQNVTIVMKYTTGWVYTNFGLTFGMSCETSTNAIEIISIYYPRQPIIIAVIDMYQIGGNAMISC